MFVGRDVGESLLEFINTLHSGWGVRNELPMLTFFGAGTYNFQLISAVQSKSGLATQDPYSRGCHVGTRCR